MLACPREGRECDPQSSAFSRAQLGAQVSNETEPGKSKAESSILFNDNHPLLVEDTRPDQPPPEVVQFDPTLSRAYKRRVPPPFRLLVGDLMCSFDALPSALR